MKYIKISTSRSLLITTILLLELSIQDPTAAGTFTTHKAKEANKSISEIPAKLFNRKPKQHDPSFAISPDGVFFDFLDAGSTFPVCLDTAIPWQPGKH